ncbi:TetR/AcrR family transcriptional regulator [Nocardioides marmoriginsengisoli]|uniref:TetR/AcrR family transcriptional regulator n=1 Tax=Nocardioides marmoriginsengisoli TaxID=661483 RepID=A0A3N0CBM5_9ACTN|nr:TetR family transcriptional regulator [Nocardioides marmoriginsengisoli]RNL60719.1 TetR/AcrR family transcriptional regulator [Nocardioides marmoriginsengisoli]
MSPRPAETRQLILDTALRLFEERGYAATTMRAIAAEAGLSPSNAYYWFANKDELVQAFYVRIQTDHAERVAVILAGGLPLTDRLRAVEHAFLDVIGAYHGFGSAFVSIAIAPDSPSSPLSETSAPAREQSLAIYREVVAGAAPRVPEKVRDLLPELLWLCHLGVTLFWVTDRSPGQERTRRLVDATVPLIGPMLRVARLPWGGAVVEQVRTALAVAMEPR